jgi:hypothetical protein
MTHTARTAVYVEARNPLEKATATATATAIATATLTPISIPTVVVAIMTAA